MRADYAEFFRKRYPAGTRVVVEFMNDPDPIPPGMHGTVESVDDMGTIHCAFDNGRRLGLIPGADYFHVEQVRSRDGAEREAR